MTPTTKLRWVERDCYVKNGEAFREPFKARVLQQWFEFRPGVRWGHNDATGEWVDVQVEKEET